MKDTSLYKFDLIPSEVDPRDYQVEAIYHAVVELPEEFNYIEEMPPIRDQGSQGSCSAMTAAAIKDWQEYKDLGYQDYMSPQFIYNLRTNQWSEGMTPRDTMNILNKKGTVPESLYPYGSTTKIDELLLEKAQNFIIKGYAQVNTIYGAKASLIANGPLYIGLPVYNPTNPRFWHQEFLNQPMLGGHAVTIVGWKKDAFIIRNSWGDDWGYNGYCYMPFEDWGVQWEVWATIDEDSSLEKLIKMLEEQEIVPKKKGCFSFLMKPWF